MYIGPVHIRIAGKHRLRPQVGCLGVSDDHSNDRPFVHTPRNRLEGLHLRSLSPKRIAVGCLVGGCAAAILLSRVLAWQDQAAEQSAGGQGKRDTRMYAYSQLAEAEARSRETGKPIMMIFR